MLDPCSQLPASTEIVPPRRREWRFGSDWPVAVGLYGVGLGLVAIAIVIWRASDRFLAFQASQAGHLTEFKAELLEAFENLAEKAGTFTSCDQAPVRFRLRDPLGRHPGTLEVMAMLECGNLPSNQTVTLQTERLNRHGTLDFGLCPPGEYRLLLLSQDGMTAELPFLAEPGRTIDRLLTCPDSLNIAKGQACGWLELPGVRPAPQLFAVLTVAPAELQVGELCWEPPGSLPELPVVCGTQPEQFGHQDSAVLSRMAGTLETPPDRDMSELACFPYRYFRVLAVRWLWVQETSPGLAESLVIGSVRFESAEPIETTAPDTLEWTVRGPAPWFEAMPGHSRPFLLPLPANLVDQLNERITTLSRCPAGQPPILGAAAASAFQVSTNPGEL